MTEVQSETRHVHRPYPRTVALGDGSPVTLRLMVPSDTPRVHTFARSLPKEDLQFLRVDITRMVAVMHWAQNVKAGRTVTVLAEKNGAVVGYGSIHNDQVSWQRHIGELRIQVSPEHRSHGLGTALGREIFALAPELGIEKIVAQMTPDQKQAIALLKRHGFREEAVLHDFVIDREGRKNDLVVMTCDVAEIAAAAR